MRDHIAERYNFTEVYGNDCVCVQTLLRMLLRRSLVLPAYVRSSSSACTDDEIWKINEQTLVMNSHVITSFFQG